MSSNLPYCQVQSASKVRLGDFCSVGLIRGVCCCYEAASFFKKRDTSRDIPIKVSTPD